MSVSARVPEGQFNKVELDVERHLLQTTVRLSDGTEGLVFSRGPKNDANLFVYICHLCKATNLIGERALQIHIYGRKHQNRLTGPPIDAESFRAPIIKAKAIKMIAPGEPVPPGFEGEVRPVPSLQPFLDNYKSGPLIGLEYIVELCSLRESQPRYHCLLCEKKGDPNTIISHVTSYNHRLQYLDKFFPSIVKTIAPFRYNYQARNAMPPLVERICKAIEEHHGRLIVTVHDPDEFPKNRNLILQQIERERHFSEENGPNFVDVIDIKNIYTQMNSGTAPIVANAPKRDKKGNDLSQQNRENFDEISSSESDSPLKSSPWNRSKLSRKARSRSSDRIGRKIKRSHSRSQSPLRRSGGGRVHRSPPFDKYDPRKRDGSNKKTAEQNQQKQRNEKFKTMLDSAIKELEKELKEHEKNPEKHPLYPEEWKIFWNRRYKELQAEKKDPNKYDYKPEWIKFWTKRMKELHLESIENKKLEIRKLCGLVESPMGKLEVIDISDDELSISPARSEKRSRKRSSGRYSHERERERERDRERDRERERGYSRHPSDAPDYYHSSSRHSRHGVRYMDPDKLPKYEPDQKEEEDVDDGPLTVVAVLRLITAVEEQLGSLGPKVIDLLAKALALEKIKANSSDEMLLNEDTSIFFETVKEKLKGQILAGVLDSSKVKAVKRAVKNIAAILHQSTIKEKKTEEKTPLENPAKTKLLKTDILDRQIIASKLAAALVVQDRTDISKDDMDRLINVFILMVKLSKERNAHVEVKDILLELGIESNIFDEDTMASNISKVESKDSREAAPVINNASSSLDSLTDSDLQTLLQNFKHLSSEEQHHLIAHLKKLESSDPIRVEKLRKFVDVGDLKRNKPSPRPEPSLMNSAKPNFSDDESDHKRAKIIESDDDDDDYNFDDVVKAASKNIRAKSDSKTNETSRPDSLVRDPEREASNLSMGSAASANTNISLANTQNLIANLLGSLQQNSSKQPAAGNNGNIIPTIGATANRPANFQGNNQSSNPDNFYHQSQPANQMNQQQYSNQNFHAQSGNMFDNSFFPGNQGSTPQQFGGGIRPPTGAGNMNAFSNSNMQNPAPPRNAQSQNFFNQFNPNIGQGHSMQPGNYMNSQNRPTQPNFFNHPVQNQGGFF